MESELIEYLAKFVTDKRFSLFQKIIEERTKYVTVVLEDIFQGHNASAVLRSCDCFGIQDVHVIENRNRLQINREVALGASKWLTLKKYNEPENNTLKAIQGLKDQGYRIVATTPHINDQQLDEFDLTKGKTALVFGTELTGISEVVRENADAFLKIPMYGFTESFNISVSVAIVLHHLTLRMRKEQIDWKLNECDREEVLLEWIKRTVKRANLLVDNYYK